MTEAVTHTVGTLMGCWHVRLVLQQTKVLAYLNKYTQKKIRQIQLRKVPLRQLDHTVGALMRFWSVQLAPKNTKFLYYLPEYILQKNIEVTKFYTAQGV